MPKILLEITKELFAAIEAARAKLSRNAWIESQLWKTKSVKNGAEEAGVENPDRPNEGRGRWRDKP